MAAASWPKIEWRNKQISLEWKLFDVGPVINKKFKKKKLAFNPNPKAHYISWKETYLILPSIRLKRKKRKRKRDLKSWKVITLLLLILKEEMRQFDNRWVLGF